MVFHYILRDFQQNSLSFLFIFESTLNPLSFPFTLPLSQKQ